MTVNRSASSFTTAFMLLVFALGLVGGLVGATPLAAQVTAFRQAVAEDASQNETLSAFYRARAFEPIWTSGQDYSRRNAFLQALEEAGNHGLPTERYEAEVLRQAFRDADTPRAQGQVEVMASAMFLQYARDVQSGMLDPNEVISDIVQDLPRRDPLAQIEAFAQSSPRAYLRSLPPEHPEYIRLMREKLRLERILGGGGWGIEVVARQLEPGDQGPDVVVMRNRLMTMGYLNRSASAAYDGPMQQAVQQFQEGHGLNADGVAGPATMAEINVSPEIRLGQILVAMERQRWMNKPRGDRHILVNIADFRGYVIDNEEITFETRVVVGATASDRRTPEFSDEMTHMVINPTWNVPRSIATNEYLPQMQSDPAAAGHLRLYDSRGRVVNRENIDFTQYTARNFPFNMRQPPSNSNALGLVKFMFPNQWNIYLHDTPSRSLFSRDVRAFSHGCVRVHRPFELAYHLLAPQEANPEAYFQRLLATGQETQVNLDTPIPVHLVYWTAWVTPEGRANFRPDIYGRDQALWRAMVDAGVDIRSIGS